MVLPKYLYCLPFFFSISAFTLLFVGTTCDYLQFTSTNAVSDPNSGESEPVSIHFGIWYYQTWKVNMNTTEIQGESCNLYPSTINVDKNWRAAGAFSLIAIIVGGSIILLDVFQGCLSTKQDKSFRTGVVMYVICCISSAFTLLLLGSNVCKHNTLIQQLNESLYPAVQFQDTCSISQGGKSAIASTVLWLAAAVGTALLHPVFTKPEPKNDDEGLDEPLFNDNSNVI